MDLFTAPASIASDPALLVTHTVAPALDDEEVPLGWECAHPALQIERWDSQEEHCG